MAPPARLSPPPRPLPNGLKLALLAQRDVYASLMYLVPAAVLSLFAQPFEDAPRLAILVLALILLVLGLQATIAGLARGARMIHYMRQGFLVPGLVLRARFAWEGKSRSKPYAQFLAQWPKLLGRSSSEKAIGCFGVALALFFLGPMAVIVVVFMGAMLLRSPGDMGSSGIGGANAVAIAAAVLVLLLGRALVRAWRRRRVPAEYERYMEWRRRAGPAAADEYDERARRLVDTVRKVGPDPTLGDALPENYQQVDLICTVEYPMGAQAMTGEGRIRFTDDLDIHGVEPLLFDARRPTEVVFLGGLPAYAKANPVGGWRDVQPGMRLAGSMASITLAVFTVVILLRQVPWLLALPRALVPQ